MFDSYKENTLEYDEELCIGCGMCSNVCPHGVFEEDGKKAALKRKESCMECGACQLNCPVDAITVDSGVGCASAMIRAALRGSKEATCGDDCCGGTGEKECSCGCEEEQK